MKCGLKTFLVLAVIAGGPCAASPSAGFDPVRAFAECAGRLSAKVEHSWLMGGNDEEAQVLRESFVDLLAAIPHDVPGRVVLDWRIRAKQDQSRLLSIATFHLDQARRTQAKSRAFMLSQSCSSLLLG